MRKALSTLLVLASFGCGEPPTPAVRDRAPALTITSPERGGTDDNGTITVAGRVDDDQPVDHVTINDEKVPVAADGSFSAQILMAPGIGLIQTLVTDSAGHSARDVRAVLVGALAAADGKLSSPLGAKVGTAAIARVAEAVGQRVASIDFDALALAANPIVNSAGCNSARVDVTSLRVGKSAVELEPGDGVLLARVTLENVAVDLHAQFQAVCVSGSTDIHLSASTATVNGELGLAVVGGKLVSSMPAATVDFQGFTLDVGGVPSAIVDLVQSSVRDAIEKMLAEMVKLEVPKQADPILGGLIAKSYGAKVLDVDVDVSVTPKQVTISSDGLFASAETKLAVAGGAGGMFVPTMPSLSSTTLPTTNLAIAIANDTVNQLFAGLWGAGAFDKQLDVTQLGAAAILLDDEARKVSIEPLLPPGVSSSGGNLALSIGDLVLSVQDEAGEELQRFAISMSATLSAAPNASGKVALTVGAPTVYAQVIVQSSRVDNPLTDDVLEGLAMSGVGLVSSYANDALAGLSLPQIEGVGFAAPSVGSNDGFVVASVPLQ